MSRTTTPAIHVPISLRGFSFGIGGAGVKTSLFERPPPEAAALRPLLDRTLSRKVPSQGGVAYLFTDAREIVGPRSWLGRIRSLCGSRFQVGSTVTVPGTYVKMTAVTRIASLALLMGGLLAAVEGIAEAHPHQGSGQVEGRNSKERGDLTTFGAFALGVTGIIFLINATKGGGSNKNPLVAGAILLIAAIAICNNG